MTANQKHNLTSLSGFSVTTLLIIVAIVTSIYGIYRYSDDAKAGDILFPIDQGAELIQLAFHPAPEERMFIEADIAKERLFEANVLFGQNKKSIYMQHELAEYIKYIRKAHESINAGKNRGPESVRFEYPFSKMVLDHLDLLNTMYESVPEEQRAFLENVIRETVNIYSQRYELLTRNKTVTEDELLELRVRFFEIQNKLSGQGIIIQ